MSVVGCIFAEVKFFLFTFLVTLVCFCPIIEASELRLRAIIFFSLKSARTFNHYISSHYTLELRKLRAKFAQPNIKVRELYLLIDGRLCGHRNIFILLHSVRLHLPIHQKDMVQRESQRFRLGITAMLKLR
jgi:hypothetical protein